MDKKLLKHFRKTNSKKQNRKNIELKKQSREKMINSMLNGMVMIIRLIVGLIKRT